MELNEDELSALTEIINIGVGQAAGVLNEVAGSHVTLRVPSLDVIPRGQMTQRIPFAGEESLACVDLPFDGEVSGISTLVFPTSSAASLVKVLLGDEDDGSELDTERIGTLTEV